LILGFEEENNMIAKERVLELTKKFGKDEKDTGAPEVQVALLTERIDGLKGHFQDHKHDYHSNRGLLKMIGKRKSILKYLQSRDIERYKSVIQALGLRK
jgi:small subunit ribosomal protein S15